MKLPIAAEAIVGLDEAMTFYEQQRPGLGVELLVAVDAAIAFAAEFPEGGEVRRIEPAGLEVRRFVVERFPYVVHVAQVRGAPEVVAIAHARRRPGYFRDRLR